MDVASYPSARVPRELFAIFEALVLRALAALWPAPADRPAVDAARVVYGSGGRPAGLRVDLTCAPGQLQHLAGSVDDCGYLDVGLGPHLVQLLVRGPHGVGLQRGPHALRVHSLPPGVSSLPSQLLVDLFAGVPGWAVVAVERVHRDGFPVGPELLVRAALQPSVSAVGCVELRAGSGQRRVGVCRYRVVVPVPALPPLTSLQAALASVRAARDAVRVAGFREGFS